MRIRYFNVITQIAVFRVEGGVLRQVFLVLVSDEAFVFFVEVGLFAVEAEEGVHGFGFGQGGVGGRDGGNGG